MSYLGEPPLSPPSWPDLKAWRDKAFALEAALGAERRDLAVWRDKAEAADAEAAGWRIVAERRCREIMGLCMELDLARHLIAELKLAPARPPEPPAPTAPDPRAVADAAVGRIARQGL